MSNSNGHVKISAYLEQRGEGLAPALGLNISMTGISSHRAMADMLRSIAMNAEVGALHDPSLSNHEFSGQSDDKSKLWVDGETGDDD